MVNYNKELLIKKDVIINILKDNDGKLGITQLVKEIKKSTEFKSATNCRDLIITAGAKGIVIISKNPPNQLIVELPKWILFIRYCNKYWK